MSRRPLLAFAVASLACSMVSATARADRLGERAAPDPPPAVAAPPPERTEPVSPPAPRAIALAPPAAAPSEPPSTSSWYGWQIVLLDAGAVVVVAASDSSGRGTSTALVLGGVGIYALGGPVTHVLHGQKLRGAASLGLRVGAPLLGGLLGAGAGGGPCVDTDAKNSCAAAGVYGALGAAVGALTAMVIDDGVLAYDDRATPTSTIQPFGSASRDGVRLGASGTF